VVCELRLGGAARSERVVIFYRSEESGPRTDTRARHLELDEQTASSTSLSTSDDVMKISSNIFLSRLLPNFLSACIRHTYGNLSLSCIHLYLPSQTNRCCSLHHHSPLLTYCVHLLLSASHSQPNFPFHYFLNVRRPKRLLFKYLSRYVKMVRRERESYCNEFGVLYSRWNFISLQKSIHYS
jgi:hypothetical protein